jgi:6,7-dimethyl-8-ribityllumazine synthase
MATHLKNLSTTNLQAEKAFKKFTIALAVAEWNNEVTFALRDGSIQFLKEKGIKEKNIAVHYVPGSFELPQAALWLGQQADVDAVITLGCVIQGETRHFDFICDACAHGVMQVGIQTGKPTVFGVLTTENLRQAKERAGGKHGNKGIEAAETALKMLVLRHVLKI